MLRDLQSLTPKAIKTLERLLEDPNPSAALGAAKEVLDRNLGKVRQSVTVDVTSTHVLHLQALETIAARKREQLQTIDITPVSVSDNANVTLDRIGYPAQSDIGATIDNVGVAVDSMSVAAGAPRPPEAPGAAAYAPTTPATHENSPTDPEEKP